MGPLTHGFGFWKLPFHFRQLSCTRMPYGGHWGLGNMIEARTALKGSATAAAAVAAASGGAVAADVSTLRTVPASPPGWASMHWRHSGPGLASISTAHCL